MMRRGVKIRLNMSPSDWIFTFGHVGVTDVLKKPVNCSRELWKWYTDCFSRKQSGAPRALAYTCPTAARAVQTGLWTRKEEESTVDHLIVTVFAPDKPGQVEQIASCIANHGGNWLESRMTHMAGQFAGILRIGVPSEAHTELRDALEGYPFTVSACSSPTSASKRPVPGNRSTWSWWVTTDRASCGMSRAC